MPATTTPTHVYTWGVYAPLPRHLLDWAVARRQQGDTYRAILDSLRLGSHGITHPTQGWTPSLLAQHVRRHADQTGQVVPVRQQARRPRPTTVPSGGALGATRRFGVEIEVKGIDHWEAHRALQAAGFPSTATGYGHGVLPEWRCTTDGSLTTGRACEVVSPILDDPSVVGQVMAVLRQAGARVDVQCGLHVHHEATDLSADALATLVEMYAGHQATLDSMVAPSRRAGAARWCAPFRRGEAARFARAFRQVQGDTPDRKRASAATLGLGGRPESRYRTLNVHAFGLFGTLEFRQHQGTLSGAKAEAWIRLGQAMLDAAATAATIRVGNLLEDLTTAGLLAPEVAAYQASRVTALA
jgi:Putative amidoligase enzyme